MDARKGQQKSNEGFKEKERFPFVEYSSSVLGKQELRYFMCMFYQIRSGDVYPERCDFLC
jgi:hypothetical protein